MTYPPGVQLATLTFSNPSTFLGNEATRTEVTVEATASVVWAATGQPIDNFEEIVSPGAGMPGSLTVPFVDQPGFTDQAGNTFANWAYVVTRKTVYGNKMKTVRKNWQPVAGQTDVDFDNLPGGAIGLPVSAPQVSVTSVAGLTGAVGDEALAGVLAPFMPAPDVSGKLDKTEAAATYAAKSVETDKLDVTTAATTYATPATVASAIAPVAADVAPLKATAVAKSLTGRVLYQPTSEAMLRWRLLRAEVLNGQKPGHIAFLGDSITFGTGGTTNKYEKSHPGQLRKILDTRYGAAGTGVIPGNNHLIATPSLDGRFTYSGATAQAWGLFEFGMFNLPLAANYVEFTAVADEFYVYTIGAPTLSVDGGTATLQSGANKLPGYSNNHLVWKVTTGSTASHTIRIAGAAAGAVQVFGVEARVTGNGRWRISNQGVDGRALNSLFLNNASGETSGLRGLPFIDSLKADLLVIGLGINDWQGTRTVAASKDLLTQTVQRQRSKATNSVGGVHAGGEAVLLWNPHPDTRDVPTGLQPVGGPSWESYRDMFYQVAQEQNCALIDLGELWGMDFNKVYGSTYGGLFADRIHPNDRGAGDMAGAIHRALFLEA